MKIYVVTYEMYQHAIVSVEKAFSTKQKANLFVKKDKKQKLQSLIREWEQNVPVQTYLNHPKKNLWDRLSDYCGNLQYRFSYSNESREKADALEELFLSKYPDARVFVELSITSRSPQIDKPTIEDVGYFMIHETELDE